MHKNIFRLLAFGLLLMTLQSCNSSYLTQNTTPALTNSFSDEAQQQLERDIINAQLSLQKPSISYEVDNPIDTNHAKIANKLEKNTFISYLDITVSNILREADSYLGTPYRFGGTTRRGIDCSAFMQKIFEVEGIDLPRISKNQAKLGIPIPKEHLQKGDLIFFSTTSSRRITHVGIVHSINENEINFIHASSSQGVIISSLDHEYWAKRFRTARRIENFITPQLVLNSSIKNEVVN
ncbi:Probable endopeptidase Spr precursor [Candidatus Ornithobacterium hominis]|uniref:Probable endopeptidase Spr n=1 Tax=Candidatus Ornithobacterium hominis TaxID=2497989 RepID=A0A383TXZ9_9FLAO|nr:C40 family peptidase [Candidatus Ornithobacterium hominis]MCT7903988.1 C40 family peptidase [Candidatus Ornithobacterium hominis]CAI9429058.1 putative endopeptidase Spr [Candidatus Ornithobacterium hominis]SZD72474.1 Probable endopeptidase Spr precursor [Candidatus Ornithobacterium hominis]